MKNRDLFLSLVRIGIAGVVCPILIIFNVEIYLSIFISIIVSFIITFIITYFIRNVKFKEDDLGSEDKERNILRNLILLFVNVSLVILFVWLTFSFF